ncbi:MAG: sugar kinase [Candidatus Protistobacter heckmanni]|nr:sugar kinase [Candidatus Protistobacter heckmanni]
MDGSEKHFDIALLGEAMVEFNQTEQAGGKLYLQGFGGDTSNFAIAAARQGVKVAYVSALGDDPYGRMLRALWDEEAVDHASVRVNPDVYTAVYFVTHDGQGHHFQFFRQGSAASRMRPADLPRGILERARVLHVSGISLAISQTASDTVFEAAAIARRAGAKISFDTNLRQRLWSVDRARTVMTEFMRQCDICLPSFDDVAVITGLNEPEAIVDHCLGLGAGVVALKLGENGALVADADERHWIAPHRCRPVDATGAGDTFGGAFVARLIAGDDLLAAGRYASVAAALSTEGFGAVEPIPGADRVRSALRPATD